jgi:type II secretory ATPase GspE/PulE/Tfp pilus assembly ATPase PilB-like protein
VRTLCKECRQEVSPDEIAVPDDFPMKEMLEQGKPFYRSNGCRACRGTGFRGRSGIYELLVNNDEIRQLVADRVPAHLVKEAARRAGMRTLRHDGWIKVMNGLTTIDEVARVAKAD